MPTLYVNDVIEFRPTFGCNRIVTVTGLGPDGFTAVLTANKTEQALGRYDQIVRVLKRADPGVDHKTKIVGIGDFGQNAWAAWTCTCGHGDTGNGEDAEAAMKNARVQQVQHRRDWQSDDD